MAWNPPLRHPKLTRFYYAACVYRGMLDGQAAEVSSRMNAMENASKNAGEMLEKLTLKCARRQRPVRVGYFQECSACFTAHSKAEGHILRTWDYRRVLQSV